MVDVVGVTMPATNTLAVSRVVAVPTVPDEVIRRRHGRWAACEGGQVRSLHTPETKEPPSETSLHQEIRARNPSTIYSDPQRLETCDDGMSGDRIVSVTPAARVARGRRRRDEGNQRDVISDAPRCTFVRSARADAHAVLTVDLDIFPTLPRCFPN